MKTIAALAGALIALAMPISAEARNPPRTFVVVNEAVGLPVFPDDIADRPYEVLGEVKAGVRKATMFSPKASEAKIYGELWERAEKLGADAVINAKYGNSHINAISWGSTSASGTAIRFRAVAVPLVI